MWQKCFVCSERVCFVLALTNRRPRALGFHIIIGKLVDLINDHYLRSHTPTHEAKLSRPLSLLPKPKNSAGFTKKLAF